MQNILSAELVSVGLNLVEIISVRSNSPVIITSIWDQFSDFKSMVENQQNT